MNKTVSHYISELLFLHDCVILPSFGGFVGNRQSAKLNQLTGILSPPSKQILFNKNLSTNDGLLINHIANMEGLSQEIAKQNVEAFAQECTTKLTTTKVVRIEKIGLFTLGKENNILFTQDTTTNYSLDAFGMSASHTKTIERQTVLEEKIIASVQHINTQSRNPRTFLRAAAVIIPLVALSYLSISQQESINNAYTQMASLNPFTTLTTETNTVEVETTPELIIEAEVISPAPIVAEEEVKIEIKAIATQKTYYIIAGAFAEQKNADKMVKKLRNWDYNPTVIKGGKLSRVSYSDFTNKEEAILALKEIQRENKSAWLLIQ